MSISSDEIWALFRETDRRIQALTQKFEETDRKFQETDRQFKETDRKLAESRQETERKLAESRQETDRKIAETHQETERLLQQYAKEAAQRSKELDKKIGALSNRLGEFVEEMVKPSVLGLFQARGIQVRTVTRDMESRDPKTGLAMQIDLFLINGDSCILIEVKSRLSHDDVNDHLERMEKFKPLFPEYQHKKALGAVAAMVIPDDVAKYAYRKGFFVIAQKGDNTVILNDDRFNPKAW